MVESQPGAGQKRTGYATLATSLDSVFLNFVEL